LFSRLGVGKSNGKPHRVCRKCREIVRRHDKWRQVKRHVFGIFGTVYEIEHKDCSDPELKIAKMLAQPETPMSQWLRENQLPATTWTGTSDKVSETIQ